MTLNIPVHQTITLPDDWQACRTPQELSYWLIAKLDGIQADITNLTELTGEIPELKQNVVTLQTSVDGLSSRVAGLMKNILDLQSRMDTVETRTIDTEQDVVALESAKMYSLYIHLANGIQTLPGGWIIDVSMCIPMHGTPPTTSTLTSTQLIMLLAGEGYNRVKLPISGTITDDNTTFGTAEFLEVENTGSRGCTIYGMYNNELSQQIQWPAESSIVTINIIAKSAA